MNISPIEIDDILSQHPDILDTAACGIPNNIYGEEVVCYVIPRKTLDLSAEKVISHCRKFLAPFETPKQVIFVERLPKNQWGKLDRKMLTSICKRQNMTKN